MNVVLAPLLVAHFPLTVRLGYTMVRPMFTSLQMSTMVEDDDRYITRDLLKMLWAGRWQEKDDARSVRALLSQQFKKRLYNKLPRVVGSGSEAGYIVKV
jgi:hypothetical protein